MKHVVMTIFVTFVFLFVSGCAGGGAGVKDQPIVVSGDPYVSDSNPLYKEISLGKISGQNEKGVWNAFTGINITSDFLKAYRNKVGQDLDDAYLLSTNKKGDYLLDIAIQKVDSPFVGSGYSTTIKYTLKKSTGGVVWDKTVTASHSVSFFEEPDSSRRLKKSKLGALTKNSELYVSALVNEAPLLGKK